MAMLARLRRLPADIAQLLLPLGGSDKPPPEPDAEGSLPSPLRDVSALPQLTAKDALWSLDADTSDGKPVARHYQPLRVAHLPGVWAGRNWMHCGPLREGVLVVAWAERDDPTAVLHWMPLDGRVRKLEEGT